MELIAKRKNKEIFAENDTIIKLYNDNVTM